MCRKRKLQNALFVPAKHNLKAPRHTARSLNHICANRRFTTVTEYKCEPQSAQILKFKIRHADQKILKFRRFKSDKF